MLYAIIIEVFFSQTFVFCAPKISGDKHYNRLCLIRTDSILAR